MSIKGINQKPFKYKIGDVVKTNTGEVTVIDLDRRPPLTIWGNAYNRKHIKYRCNIDGYEGWIMEYLLTKGHGCKLCGNNAPIIGRNTIAVLHPEKIKWFWDEEEAYTNTPRSGQYADFKCVVCGEKVPHKSIAWVFNTDGPTCPLCADTHAYPFGEKVMWAILTESKMNFSHDRSFSWSETCRYDFILHDYKVIIEVNGDQHYNTSFDHTEESLIDQQETDYMKQRRAMNNGCQHYIVIKSITSDFFELKKEIENSDLRQYIDFDKLDWEKIEKDVRTPFAQHCLDLWNSGLKSTIKIGEKLGTTEETVRKRLKHFAKLGLCDYDADAARTLKYCSPEDRNYTRTKAVICLETLDIFERMIWATRWCGSKHIYKCCQNKRKRAGKHPVTKEKLSWMYLEDYLERNPDITDIESFIVQHKHEPIPDPQRSK